MNVEISFNSNVIIFKIEGSIDSKTAGDLQLQIMDKVTKTDNVILSLSNVDFVSSAGLRLLLMVYRQIKLKNGQVILVGVSEEIKDVMSMTGFINFFNISNTIDDALILF